MKLGELGAIAGIGSLLYLTKLNLRGNKLSGSVINICVKPLCFAYTILTPRVFLSITSQYSMMTNSNSSMMINNYTNSYNNYK